MDKKQTEIEDLANKLIEASRKKDNKEPTAEEKQEIRRLAEYWTVMANDTED